VRKADVFFRSGRLVAVACLTLAGTLGCGSQDKSSVPGTTVSKPHKAKVAKTNGPPDLAEMVAAVGASRPGPPVEMKFLLSARPEVGQALDVDVALIPLTPLPDTVSAYFQAAEGLEVVDGAQLEQVQKLVNGSPIHHTVKIIPKRDGIFTLSAVVTFSQDNQELNRTFSIPVIAGEGLPQQVAKGP
jgi:hypothetical protein